MDYPKRYAPDDGGLGSILKDGHWEGGGSKPYTRNNKDWVLSHDSWGQGDSNEIPVHLSGNKYLVLCQKCFHWGEYERQPHNKTEDLPTVLLIIRKIIVYKSPNLTWASTELKKHHAAIR